MSSTRIGEPFAALNVIRVSAAPIVLVKLNDLWVPSNWSSKLFNFSNSPNVNPAKLSLNVSRTVSMNGLNVETFDASVGIPACPSCSIVKTSPIL